MSAADELRKIVAWMNWQYESILDGYSIEQIIKIYKYMKTNIVPDMLHLWTTEDFNKALSCDEHDDMGG